jgi:hypothetical protein
MALRPRLDSLPNGHPLRNKARLSKNMGQDRRAKGPKVRMTKRTQFGRNPSESMALKPSLDSPERTATCDQGHLDAAGQPLSSTRPCRPGISRRGPGEQVDLFALCRAGNGMRRGTKPNCQRTRVRGRGCQGAENKNDETNPIGT